MALCLAISTPLCEGNDCRCVRKPLVGTRRSKQETNKHYGVFGFSFWITAVLHLLESLASHLQLFPLPDCPHYIQTPISTTYFLNEDMCNCTLMTNLINPAPWHPWALLPAYPAEIRPSRPWQGPVLLCHDASIAPSVCLLQGPKTICCKLYYGLFRLICCLQTRCDWVSIHRHNAKIACLVAPNANSDSFETGREERGVTGVCLGEDIFPLRSDLPPLLPRDGRDTATLLPGFII